MAVKGGVMETRTDRNRQIVEEGLQKRATARQQQEQRHEDMRRAMFHTINEHCTEERIQRGVRESIEAEKAARKLANEKADKRLRKLMCERNKGVRRSYGAVAASLMSCILFAIGGIRWWVAVPICVIACLVVAKEVVRSVKRTPAIAKTQQRKERLNERV